MFEQEWIEPLKLKRGPGKDFKNGLCFMEAVSWLDGGEATDKPDCACPLLGHYAIFINDMADDQQRQKLLPFAVDMAGTRSTDHHEKRMRFLATHTQRIWEGMCQQVPRSARFKDFERVMQEVDEHLDYIRYKRRHYREQLEDTLSLYGRFFREVEHIRIQYPYIGHIDEYTALSEDIHVSSVEQRIIVFYPKEYMLGQMIDLLESAIMIGPNGRQSWQNYVGQAKALGKFAKEELKHVHA